MFPIYSYFYFKQEIHVLQFVKLYNKVLNVEMIAFLFKIPVE